MHFSDFLAGPNFFARKLAQRADRACRMIQPRLPRERIDLERVLRQADGGRAPGERRDDRGRRLRQGRVRLLAGSAGSGAVHARYRAPCGRVLEGRDRAGAATSARCASWSCGSCARGHTIIGEFGQAYWLDKRHGFSPTSSHTFTPEFFESANIPVQPIHTFGVAKAYDTKVGTHTFLTQMDEAHPLGAKLKTPGVRDEHGQAAHGGLVRRRREGRRPALRRIPGPDDQQAGRADLVGGLEGRPAAVHGLRERPDGERCSHVPRNEAVRKSLRPVYKRFPGWAEDISGVRRFADLPANARRYVARHGERHPGRRLRGRIPAREPAQPALSRRRARPLADHQGRARRPRSWSGWPDRAAGPLRSPAAVPRPGPAAGSRRASTSPRR